jgi:acetyl-CoA carboxylase carboxyl transferase subunit beta
MQEGMLSLVQMGKTTAAAMRLHQAGVPSITVLTNPTTGGVYASFASQGDFLFAEPGALIGFAGPRVIEQLTGEKPPPGTHTAEFLIEHGQLDGVVDRARLRGVLATLLQLFMSRGPGDARAAPEPYRPPSTPPQSAWPEVQLARREDRPTTADYIRRLMPQFVELRGDRVFGDDHAVIAGIGDLAGMTVCAIGQERGHGDPRRNGGRLRPEGFRKAARVMRLAAELRLPLITFIDTPGAYPGIGAEERGQAEAIGRSLYVMAELRVPVVCTVIGEGGSGGALAIAVGDVVMMLQYATYSVISPEGCASILWKSAEKAPEAAETLGITASRLKTLGVIDKIVNEPLGGAHRDPAAAANNLRKALQDALRSLSEKSPSQLVEERFERLMGHGKFRETDIK